MNFNQRKRILEDNINDNARRLKDSVTPFPDGSAKSEMMTIIENTRKDLKSLGDITII
jgi:hypothetical protein